LASGDCRANFTTFRRTASGQVHLFVPHKAGKQDVCGDRKAVSLPVAQVAMTNMRVVSLLWSGVT